MPDKIGRFEIVSQLAHSDYSSVYKATDPETGNFVALKAVNLQPLGEQAAALIKEVLAEAETAKILNSHNVVALYGAGEMDGQLCALMEYVQGNSIATMLERKEGFSIWDLQDIARQACQGLDHTHVHKVFHHSLEPAKIMVQWDGITRILGFGISTTGDYAAQSTGTAPTVLHYMSPEQLRGDPVDARSNFFSIGAILYEMVTEKKAFDGEDADTVRQAIMENAPVPPNHVNGRVHPGLSAVIMKALAKSPEERYQSGQDLINDLEKCKDAPAKAAPKKQVGTAPAVQKPLAPVAQKPAPKPSPAAVNKFINSEPEPKAMAAAAGAGAESEIPVVAQPSSLDSSSQFITNCVKATIESVSKEVAKQSAATVEPPETQPSKFAVDPMMDEARQAAGKAKSFSEIDELPPLKEVYIAPSPVEPPPQVEEAVKPSIIQRKEPEKPRTPPSEIAKKAVSEIKKTPPHLVLYSLTAAVVVILAVVIGIMLHLRSADTDNDESSQPETTASSSAPQTQAAPAPAPTQTAPAQAPAPTPARITPPPPVESQPRVAVTPRTGKGGKKKGKQTAPAAPTIVAGELNIDSVPEGAHIQIDGQNSGAATPFDMTKVAPGQHTVVISKDGYAPQTRTIQVNAGSSSSISVQLALLTATISVTSDPSGSAVWMDGKNTGRVTPAQFSVDKAGTHTFVFKKDGYLDATASANVQTGQTSHLSGTLQALGVTDDIKVGGKFKKLFGGSETAGMGKVSVKTDPKGAQVAVNNRMIDKMSPVEFFLNPGTYVIDITLSGYKDIHKIINVDKNGKIAIDESMDRQ
ncbi:MAG TPA: PEGA domain-containing protein [Terriglobales bacterium]|nr:PEGA domain-containing protein [Terriglobales bacterium]